MRTKGLITGAEGVGPFIRVTLRDPELAGGLSPGRFVLADLGGYVRTCLFPVPAEPGELAVLVPPDHAAAALQVGEEIDLIGPVGHGFKVPVEVRRLLLVADSEYLPILLPLADVGESRERSVSVLLSAPSNGELYPVRSLPPSLEIHVATADGSVGHQGAILDVFPELAGWPDCICIAASPTIYPELAQHLRDVRMLPGSWFAQVLVVPPMVCGVGACRGCAVALQRGFQLACTDGPVFDLMELSFEYTPWV